MIIILQTVSDRKGMLRLSISSLFYFFYVLSFIFIDRFICINILIPSIDIFLFYLLNAIVKRYLLLLLHALKYFCTNNPISCNMNEVNVSSLTRKACYRIIDNRMPS